MHEVNDMLCIVLIDLAKPLGVPSRNSVECDIDKDIKKFNVFCLWGMSQPLPFAFTWLLSLRVYSPVQCILLPPAFSMQTILF